MISKWRLRMGTVLALAWALCMPLTAAAQHVHIETGSQGELITVTASADMQVDPATVWQVISDYEHLAQFIPDMRSSHVVERNGDKLLVEQTGQFRFLYFRQPVNVKLAVDEFPPQRIVARAVDGNLKEFEGRYTLENLPTGGVRLSYSGRLIPEFPVPPVIGRMVVRAVLARQFSAMVKEILRRDSLARDALPAR